MKISSGCFRQIYEHHDNLGNGRLGEASKAKNRVDLLNYAVRTIDRESHNDAIRELLKTNDQILSLGHDNIIQTVHWSIPQKGTEGKILM